MNMKALEFQRKRGRQRAGTRGSNPGWGAKSQNSRRDSTSHPHVHQWLMVTAEGGAASPPYWGGIIHEPAPIGSS
jgi:hypothetical protein